MLFRKLALATSLTFAAAPAVAYADTTDAVSYAEREKQDPQAGEFQGGDIVVIGVSGGAMIVLLFLLLILV